MNSEEATITLTRAQLKEIIHDSVGEAMTRLGVDAQNPLEMQRDFQHLRDWRLSVQAVKKKGVMALIGILVSGICAFIWLGFKVTIQH